MPGHHLQIALQQELDGPADVPPLRATSTPSARAGALYSERLGLEAGFYKDPYSNFGRLTYEMWRACRLVVDTGLHAKGWTRQQAIDYLAEQHRALAATRSRTEVDRYIAWPGQALAYKMGELKIRELRARAEKRLGARFDLRAFHDAVLAQRLGAARRARSDTSRSSSHATADKVTKTASFDMIWESGAPRRSIMRLGPALLVFLLSTTAAAQQFATVTTNAPIYAAAQETPTPLRVAAVGTRLAVLSTDRDWVQVEYNDPQLGRRVGWVQRRFISLTSTDLRPMDLSVPEALPAPSVSVEATPAPTVASASIPFPRAETSLGWSFLRVSRELLDMNSAVGWNVSVAGNVSPWLGIVGDVTGNYKSGSTESTAVADEPDVAFHTFTGGPRFSARTSNGAVPFAEFLVGFTRTSRDIDGLGESSTEFTIQPGAGVDIGNERVAARFSVAWRRVFYEGEPTNMFRFVGGVVIRR